MLKNRIRSFALLIAAALVITGALELLAIAQQKPDTRDEFFWLGQINKATAVINTDEGLLDKGIAPRIAAGVAKVIEEGNKPGGERPKTVITCAYRPLRDGHDRAERHELAPQPHPHGGLFRLCRDGR
jgi:hypothetical protein